MPPALPKFGIIEAWSSLTDGILGEDYLPTRDSSSRDGSVFSYKHLNGELAATGSSRGRLCEYRGTVFGEVSGHSMEDRGLLVKLAPLPLAGPRGQASYNRQIKVLEHIVEVERCQQVGQTRSWVVEQETGGSVGCAKAFQVFFPPDPRQPLIDDMPVGTPIAVCVHFCRIDREKGDTVDRTYRLYANYFLPFHAPATTV